MSTKALIVDEAAGVRTLFTRILRSLDCSTYEAEDGATALDLLAEHDIKLAVIESEMALLSGLDLLAALRSSEKYANLPVVVITNGADQSTITEVVRLGAADCLTKPFDVEVLRSRLQRVLSGMTETTAVHTTVAHGAGMTGSALIVDQNPEFRHFVSNVLMATHSTMQVESGVAALRSCQTRRFSVLVMGNDTGLLAPRLLARRLRRQAELEDMRLVLVTPKDASKDVVDAEAFDAILTRTFVPEEFAQQFNQLFSRSQTGGPGAIEDVRRTLVSATEQALGMMAHTDVSLVEDEAQTLPPEEFQGSTLMKLQMERACVRFELRCGATTAIRIAARMMGVTDEEVSPEDGLSGLGELVNVIAGRVKSQISSEGGSMSFSLPELATLDVGAAQPPSEVTLRFTSPDQAIALALHLNVVDVNAVQ